MLLQYSLSSGSYTFYIGTEGATEFAEVTVSSSSDWFISALPNFYFVGTSITDGEADTIFRNQIITFDSTRLANIIDDNSYNFEVKQYTRTQSDYQNEIQLHFGDSSVQYTASADATWDASNTSSNFTVDSSNRVTINDELSEDGVSSVEFGNHSGNVVFKATVSGTGDSYKVPDDDKESIIASLENFNTSNNIILGNNIYYDGNIVLSDATLYGDGHILNMFGTMSIWKNMIEVNGGGLIDNTTFVFMVDLSSFDYEGEANYNSSLIYLGVEGTGELNEVKLYGALRNITSNTTDDDGEVLKDARNSGSETLPIRNVYMLSSSGGSTVNSVTSYMTMQGNSAKANSAVVSTSDATRSGSRADQVNGASVSVVLDISTEINASNTFIVLGDGANGANGADGANNGGTGYNGGNGGKAGVIQNIGMTTEDGTVTAATVFKGADGVGGNGGNGADGNNATLNFSAWTYSPSKGGGGGGAYGLDAYLYSRDSYNLTYTDTPTSTKAEILSNRRETRDGNNLDDTRISALAGSGGTGGLGLIYYSSSLDGIKNAYNNGEGKNSGAIFYPGASGEDFTDYLMYRKGNWSTWYIQASGGGSAGLRYKANDGISIAQKGTPGNQGKIVSPSLLDGNGISRGRGGLIDGNTAANYSYYWADNHGVFADEFLFGNLQFIPALSHWYLNSRDGMEPTNIPEPYEDIAEEIGELVPDNYYDLANPNIGIDDYEIYVKNYILASNRLVDYGNSWKEIFYGATGGRYVNIDIGEHSYLIGGTPYTSEIYGYTFANWSAYMGVNLGNFVADQYFFSRNDMVTSAGYYGTAQGLIAQGAPDLTN